MNEILIEEPGFLTTVQDLGRPGHAAAGVSASGAADPIALKIGNRLAGNEPGDAALEMTILGGAFRFAADAVCALTGAETGARIGDQAIPPWRAFEARGGALLSCSALRGGSRSYLCVRGGVSVPLVFGSASTHLLSGLGGLEGRALRAGDRVPVGKAGAREPLGHTADPSSVPGYRSGEPFRVTRGPQASWFDAGALGLLCESAWHVSEACDRMGIRLSGARILPSVPRELATEGVPLGAIQIPPSGSPIVLFVEHQTTGGYPKLANVVAADLARLGTLRPRDTIRFQTVTLTAARDLLRAQQEALDAILA